MKYKLGYDKHGALCVEPAGRGKILYRNDDIYLFDNETEARAAGAYWAFQADRYVGRIYQLPGYNLPEANR